MSFLETTGMEALARTTEGATKRSGKLVPNVEANVFCTEGIAAVAAGAFVENAQTNRRRECCRPAG